MLCTLRANLVDPLSLFLVRSERMKTPFENKVVGEPARVYSVQSVNVSGNRMERRQDEFRKTQTHTNTRTRKLYTFCEFTMVFRAFAFSVPLSLWYMHGLNAMVISIKAYSIRFSFVIAVATVAANHCSV